MNCSVAHLHLTGTTWPAAHQAYLSHTISQSLPKFLASVMLSSHLTLWGPLLLLPSIFPSIRDFSNEPSVHIRWPNTGASASASVLPVNIQSWSPLRLIGLISLLAKGLAGVFCSTAVQRHQFFGVLPSSGSSSHNWMWSLWRQWWWWFSH